MSENMKMVRMKELVEILNRASRAYYNDNQEIMSNYEYDALYDELSKLEEQTHTVLSNSPTINVGYEVLGELKKVTHEYPMLSLDKTKEVSDLVAWLNHQQGVLSWKLDGLTTVLTYEKGSLKQAVTRGNGIVGEDITHNVRVYSNIPQKIDYEGKLIIRGESVIKYSDFERINNEIAEIDAKYKNPRNLCSGTVRQLNSEICAKRNVHFFAFNLVDAGDFTQLDTVVKRFDWLSSLGFDVVEHTLVKENTLMDTVHQYAEKIAHNDFPSDGLVLTFNDIEYGKSLGTTAKFPKDSIAFKWQDEIVETVFKEVEWSASRTGLINPVAVFEPVEIEGTSVSRASLHNVSILQSFELGSGDTVTVFKANMIIPQLADNLTRSNTVTIPETCPVCHQLTKIKEDNDVKVLLCTNDECPAKKVKSFVHFVSRDAMNMEGLSEATIEKFIQNGFLKSFSDIFHLSDYRDSIVMLEGFGERSYNNLVEAIERSRNVKIANFLYSLGIPNVGLSNAKLLCRHFSYDWNQLKKASAEEYMEIDGIGECIAQSMVSYFTNPHNEEIYSSLLKEVVFEQEKTGDNDSNMILSGKTFVITGSLSLYENRNAMKTFIESIGGKVSGSVSSKTSYLINNDITSNSSKNKKAKELDIPIITEAEFQEMLNNNKL